jgi:8-oxo-dGTP diphosphatase
VVAGIIRRSGSSNRFLIARRQKGKHLEDLWEFPGGKMEPGENRFFALRRELFEELGITVLQARPFQTVQHRYHDRHIVLDVWEIEHYAGTAHGREDQPIRWIRLDQIGGFEFPPADAPILSALKLPRELLITPDVSPGYEDVFVDHFATLMARKPYQQIQFRSHHLDDGAYLEIARAMAEICASHRAELVINRSSFESHRSSKFDDFPNRHLNSRLLNALVEPSLGDGMILSASCHDAEELKRAQRLGCRYAILSTVRPTISHPGRTPKGWGGLKRLIRSAGLPVYALGGVGRRDLTAARYQGAIGVAGITDFWNVSDGFTVSSGKA